MATTEHFYTGNASTTSFGYSFPILQNSDLKVELDGVLKTENTSGTNNDYSISGTNVVFNSAPGSSVDIHIYRLTDVDSAKAVFAAGSSIRAGDLNNNVDQSLYADQEQQQKIKTSDVRDDAITTAKIKDGTIVNANINASAAIDGTKISPNFGSQNIVTSGTVDGRDVSADGSKLDGIESGATGDQTNAEIRAAVEAATDSNVFTDADHTKLNGIETGATADQTNAEIRAAVEAASDSNVFTDADHTKLNSLGTLNALSDVDTTGVSDNKILKYQASSSKFVVADDTGGGGGSSTFTGLSDSPTNYTGAAGKTVKVNSAGNGLEFVTVTTPTQDIVDDTTPQLGGNLDVQTNEITTSTTNGNVKLTPNGTGAIEVKGAGGNDGTLQLNCSQNSHGVKIKSPAHSAGASYTLTLPTALGSNGYALVTDALGQLSFGPVIPSQTSIISLYDQSGTPVQRLLATTEGVQVQGTSGGVSKLMFRDRTTAYKVKFKPVDTLSADVEFTLPSADGSNGQYLKTNGSGVLSFADVTSTYDININTLSSSSGSGGGSATFNGSATRFTLSNAGTNAQAHIVSVNGVIQKPNSGTSPSEGFAIDGNDIIFASAPASGSDFFILTLGNTISIGTPSDNTVTSAKIVDGTIVNADINTSAAIAGSKLADDSITEAKLDIHAAPSGTDKVLGYTANGMEWVVAAAGATGGGTDKIFYENGQTVTTNYTITNNTNAMSAGPVTINNGVAVTIGTGENWTIV